MQRAAEPSMRGHAYESLRQQLLDANIGPGQFVSQRELMQLLGMSPGAVRELIPRLEATATDEELAEITSTARIAACSDCRGPSRRGPLEFET